MGVGVGEAVLAPAAYSLLADYFEPSMRGRAVGFYYVSLSLGAGASFVLGGAILKAMTGVAGFDLPVLGHFATWQIVFIVAGSPGLLMALLLLTVPEPPRRADVGTPNDVAHGFLAYAKPHYATFTTMYAS